MQETSSFTQKLEDEAIYILRETYAQFKNPALLFSGGKDSTTIVHLAIKAFWPAPVPFTLVHIDTGHNFSETLIFRDELVNKFNLKLVVRHVEDTIRSKHLKEESGPYASRNVLQTFTLLDTISELNIDACIGGARRDEERSRAKERFFSFRDKAGRWDVKHQRPELFDLLNGRINPGEHIRVFPLSNWTELDVWQYIKREEIEVPSIYYTHEREVFERDGLIWSADPVVFKSAEEKIIKKNIRFRTVGDMTCTAACESDAKTVDEIIREISLSQLSERGARIDDKRTEAAMEKKKNGGLFLMELIRISTAGSVDDGKSTLIGQLLVGTNSVSEDKFQAVREASQKKGMKEPDLSLLTDGLIAEREQGITIDVAHIYFSTKKRKYIIADSPGHFEYTRNMVTGASTAEIFVILIDVQKGLSEQTYRHAYIADMLRIPNVIVCINKMDTVGFDQQKFESLRQHFLNYIEQLSFHPKIVFIPTSALFGDNVITHSEKTKWYNGTSLLETIESSKSEPASLPFRFRHQTTLLSNEEKIKPAQFLAGKVISGSIQLKDGITVLPSQQRSAIKSLFKGPQSIEKASASDSVSIELEDNFEVERGSILVVQGEELELKQEFKAEICWLDEIKGKENSAYWLQFGSYLTKIKLHLPNGQKNLMTLEFEKANGGIELNEITVAGLESEKPIPIESYSKNKWNGSFILIDEQSNKTVAVGFVE